MSRPRLYQRPHFDRVDQEKPQARGPVREGGKHAVLVEAAVIGMEQGFLGYSDRDKGRYPFKTDFVKKFDAVIYQMQRQGEIARIAEEFFKNN